MHYYYPSLDINNQETLVWGEDNLDKFQSMRRMYNRENMNTDKKTDLAYYLPLLISLSIITYTLTGFLALDHSLNIYWLLAAILYDLLVIYQIVKYSFRTGKIVFSLILYILSTIYMILAFASIYSIVGIIEPISTNLSIINDKALVSTCDVNPIYDYKSTIYFSTITWTSLGYGDILPSVESRVYIMLEAAFGYVHMSLLIGLILQKLSLSASLNQTK